jgi:hypothetical protein
MTATQAIPFRIELRHLYRGAMETEHALKFGVVGAAEPAVVIIASDLYRYPHIVEHIAGGQIELSDELFCALACKCFTLIASAIIEQSGESGWWNLSDISRFIHKQFRPEEARTVIDALSAHVQEGLTVQDTYLVADDDAI